MIYIHRVRLKTLAVAVSIAFSLLKEGGIGKLKMREKLESGNFRLYYSVLRPFSEGKDPTSAFTVTRIQSNTTA